MRKLELIAAFAICAAATPVMAQGRGHGNGHSRGRGLGVGGVPPGQVVAGQHRRNDREDRDDDDDNGRDDRNGQYGRNGGYNLPNGAVVLPNGQVVYPTGTNPNGGVYYPNQRYPNGSIYYPNGNTYPNGQQCGQITDRNGNVRTVCRNQRGDGDEDDRYQGARRNRANGMKFKKGKKHHDRDREGDEG